MVTPEQVTQLRDAAFRGAELMDVRGPQDWPWNTDPDTLSMRHPNRCVVGQNYDGMYRRGLERLGVIGPLLARNAPWEATAAHYGFQLPDEMYLASDASDGDREVMWAELGKAWRDEIAQRRDW